MRRMVEAPTRWPSLSSSPWILTYPQFGFSTGARPEAVEVPGPLSGRLPCTCYRYSSPQWLQFLKPTPAKLYRLQDGHRVTCVPQSTHLIVSFDCHALRSRLGIFRGFDNIVDPLSKDPTI